MTSHDQTSHDGSGLGAVDALRFDGLARAPREEWVAEETPIALLYNGLSFAVMMATPADLEDFALGFAMCEGIVAGPEEFALVDVVRSDAGIALHAAIPQRRYDSLADSRRTLEGRSGCGLCGIADLQAVLHALPVVGAGPRITAARIHAGLDAMSGRQPINARSGGVHAAGFVHGGDPLVREDVGRHNAVDKLVGALLRASPEIDRNSGVLAVTSRASFEIVRKAAHAGIAVVAAMSAPTDLAIRQAETANITLIAFAREGRMNVYSHANRIAIA